MCCIAQYVQACYMPHAAALLTPRRTRVRGGRELTAQAGWGHAPPHHHAGSSSLPSSQPAAAVFALLGSARSNEFSSCAQILCSTLGTGSSVVTLLVRSGVHRAADEQMSSVPAGAESRRVSLLERPTASAYTDGVRSPTNPPLPNVGTMTESSRERGRDSACTLASLLSSQPQQLRRTIRRTALLPRP